MPNNYLQQSADLTSQAADWSAILSLVFVAFLNIGATIHENYWINIKYWSNHSVQPQFS